jgi:hypothetical protein
MEYTYDFIEDTVTAASPDDHGSCCYVHSSAYDLLQLQQMLC